MSVMRPTLVRCLRPGPKIAWLALLAWVLMCPRAVRAETKIEPTSEEALLADRYVESYVRRERLTAENALLLEEIQFLLDGSEPDDPGIVRLFGPLPQLDDPNHRSLAGVLETNVESVVDTLDDSAETLATQVLGIESRWRSIRTELIERRLLFAQVAGSRQIASQFASLFSIDKRWFWLLGLMSLGSLLGVVFHERRHEIRKFLSGGRAKAMELSKCLTALLGLLTIATVVTFLLGGRIYESMLTSGEQISPKRRLDDQIAALKEEITPLQQRHDALLEQHERAERASIEKLSSALPPKNRTAESWQRFRSQTLEIRTMLSLLKRLPEDIERDRQSLIRLNAKLDEQAEETRRYLRLRQWIRGGLGMTLLALVGTGGWIFRRGVRSRQRVTAATCPLCLGVNHLVSIGDRDPSSRTSGELPMVQCRNVISEEPYEECDYSFMEVYRRPAKIFLPTLGVPQAGKTHWLTMLYWELSRGNFPRSVEFEKIKSQSSEDFDLIVEEILTSRIGTAATQRDRIPYPLVFNLQDRDWAGRTNVLVNVFDYSGEVTSDMSVDDYRRRRALDADGFFFFLDPTYPSEPQAKALADFREDVRLVKGLHAGRQLRIPIALCVSKIDVLAGQSYALPDGGDAVERFYRELGEIDPTGESRARKVIEARSEAFGRLRDLIWPGWQIERQVDDLFGGRHLFFPLTPVGLEGAGETDLNLRTISPFGLLEPLLWLLEMNGLIVSE